EDLAGEELLAKRPVEPLDLAGRRGAPGRSKQVIDAVLAADPIEQHLDVLVCEPPGEDLAVVGEDHLRDAVAAHGLGEVGAHSPACGTRHDPAQTTNR